MEVRQILIADTRSQRRYTIESAATTLGELQDQMALQGIDFSGMSFTEGVSNTQLISRDSVLPTNIPYKGSTTNNLAILLTNTTKNIPSGAMSRKDLYAAIKALGLAEIIKEEFGDNYTRVSSADLEQFVARYENKNNVCKKQEECLSFETVKELPHADLVNWLYDGIKVLTTNGQLYGADVAALTDLLTELKNRMAESSPFSDEEIDEMLANI